MRQRSGCPARWLCQWTLRSGLFILGIMMIGGRQRAKISRRRFGLACSAMLATQLAPARLSAEPVPVTVGGYVFPPFVDLGADGSPTGLTIDVIEWLNAAQSDYRFSFFLTSPARRFNDFEARRFDAMFFESPEWGWKNRQIQIDATEVFLLDYDIFVARRVDGRTQSFFDDLGDKRIAGMLGYHYAFTGFERDPGKLESEYGMILVNDNRAAIQLVLAGRADMAIVARSYLEYYLGQTGEGDSGLLMSDTPDQIYRYRALVRPESPLAAKRLFTWISRAIEELGYADRWMGTEGSL